MGDKKQRIIPAHYSWNSSIFTRGVVDPIKRKLGWVDENERPVSLKESATGQEWDRVKDTAKDTGKLVATGLAFSNPVTASSTMAPLITGSQAYFMTEGLKDAYNRVTSPNKTVADGAMVALDVAGAVPAFSAVRNGYRFVKPAVKSAINTTREWIVPTQWLQGEDAVKMFKRYGTQYPTVENSPLMETIRKYVPEARERYGLIGNTNITDDEIAGALYKKSMKLSGKNNGAVNEFGEPLILFRGDTQRYDKLMERMSPEELANKSGTMDNSLGNLFLGEYPGLGDNYSENGVTRYLSGKYFDTYDGWIWRNSATGAKRASKDASDGYRLFFNINGNPNQRTHYTGFIKDASTAERPNDLNAFVVKTPNVRDATHEISVLRDSYLTRGQLGSTPHMSTKYIEDKDGFPLFLHKDGSTTPALVGYENRPGMAEHYRYILDDAKIKKQGLLRSDPKAALRDEHDSYTYYAVPNFNINNVKHLLQYNFNRPHIPILDKGMIYRKQGGILKRVEKAQTGIKFEDWYKTVPKDKNDTTKFNLRRAFELAPKDQLNAFVKDPDAHLYSTYFNKDTGEYEFVKRKDHPTIQLELDWYNSDDPEAVEFRKKYKLDTSGDYYKYIPIGKSGIHIKPENRGKFTALKKRTGKSSTWYKEHGTPAQKKMAVFALNAKKWKH